MIPAATANGHPVQALGGRRPRTYGARRENSNAAAAAAMVGVTARGRFSIIGHNGKLN